MVKFLEFQVLVMVHLGWSCGKRLLCAGFFLHCMTIVGTLKSAWLLTITRGWTTKKHQDLWHIYIYTYALVLTSSCSYILLSPVMRSAFTLKARFQVPEVVFSRAAQTLPWRNRSIAPASFPEKSTMHHLITPTIVVSNSHSTTGACCFWNRGVITLQAAYR